MPGPPVPRVVYIRLLSGDRKDQKLWNESRKKKKKFAKTFLSARSSHVHITPRHTQPLAPSFEPSCRLGAGCAERHDYRWRPNHPRLGLASRPPSPLPAVWRGSAAPNQAAISRPALGNIHHHPGISHVSSSEEAAVLRVVLMGVMLTPPDLWGEQGGDWQPGDHTTLTLPTKEEVVRRCNRQRQVRHKLLVSFPLALDPLLVWLKIYSIRFESKSLFELCIGKTNALLSISPTANLSWFVCNPSYSAVRDTIISKPNVAIVIQGVPLIFSHLVFGVFNPLKCIPERK